MMVLRRPLYNSSTLLTSVAASTVLTRVWRCQVALLETLKVPLVKFFEIRCWLSWYFRVNGHSRLVVRRQIGFKVDGINITGDFIIWILPFIILLTFPILSIEFSYVYELQTFAQSCIRHFPLFLLGWAWAAPWRMLFPPICRFVWGRWVQTDLHSTS